MADKTWEEWQLQRIAEWRQAHPVLFCWPPNENITQESVDAIARYIITSLSRGRVPPVEPVIETLKGKPVPSCGLIGCLFDEGHVH